MRSVIPLLVLFTGCNVQPATIVIGHISPLTGPEKAAGEQAVNGIKLALDDYATTAPTDKPARPIVVRHADDRGDLATAEGQAVRLATVNHALILLGGADAAEASRIAKAGRLVLSPIGARDKSMSDLVIPSGLSPAQRGRALAELLKDTIKPAAIVYVVEPGDDANAALAAFQTVWEQAKLPASDKHEIGDAQSDSLKEWAAKLPATTLPVVFVPPTVMTTLALETPLRDRPLAYAGPELLRQPLKNRNAPIYLVTSFGNDDKTAEFAKRYEAKFQTPAEPQAALAYDDARIAFEVLKKSDPWKLRDELGSLKQFAGLTGTFTIAEGAINRPAFVGTLRGGAFSTVK